MTPPTRTESYEAALALMPELADHVPPVRNHRHVVGRLLATLAALALVATVVGTGLLVTLRASDQFARHDVAAAELGANEMAQFSRWAQTPLAHPLAPVVLTYHDIQPEPVESPYVVTPDGFARQMAMFQAAGYQSLTADQFTAYQRGEFDPPPRSFLLTFDDGTAGLWRYADSVLERYGFTAVSFVITGRVDTRKPYYLTWDLIAQMHASGRWDFASHTAHLHSRVPISATGAVGGALSHRTFSNGTLEAQSEFETRIREDLQQSISDLVSHGLPRPQLFAYPFSDVVAKGVGAEQAAVPRSIVSEFFSAAFVDVEPGALPASRREVGNQVIGRAEVFHRDDELSVFRRLQQMATLPVSSLDPLRADVNWFEDGGAYPAPLTVDGDRLVVDALTETYVTGNWAPQRTADWIDYSVSGRILGLLPEGKTGAGITVRVGSAAEVRIRVSHNAIQVTEGGRSSGPPIPLQGASVHEFQVTVRQGSTVIAVDGTTRLTLPSASGPATFGGFGVVYSRSAPRVEFPVLVGLHVTPAA